MLITSDIMKFTSVPTQAAFLYLYKTSFIVFNFSTNFQKLLIDRLIALLGSKLYLHHQHVPVKLLNGVSHISIKL